MFIFFSGVLVNEVSTDVKLGVLTSEADDVIHGEVGSSTLIFSISAGTITVVSTIL